MPHRKYTYHYSTMRQTDFGFQHIDGIFSTNEKILSMEDYTKVKREIDPENFKNMTIVSLNLISTKD